MPIGQTRPYVNRPRSIDQYSNMAPRLSGQTSIFGVVFFVSKGAFVWDQSGIRIIGIMQVSVCLGAILIPEYLDSILAILLPGAE